MSDSQQMRVDYNQIAAHYHQRYQKSSHQVTGDTLLSLVHKHQPQSMLEVGCGTGKWLGDLQPIIPHVIGLDFSLGMLRQAQGRGAHQLVNGHALHLPFARSSFDFVLCAHAIHHFGRPEPFLEEAIRVLKSGGTLIIIHLIRPSSPHNWYVYQHFDKTYETDRQRYPAFGQMLDWLIECGVEQASWQIVDRFILDWVGQEVLDDPFLKKDSTSQLILLSDEAYDTGLQSIRRKLEATPDHVFKVRNLIGMLVATLP